MVEPGKEIELKEEGELPDVSSKEVALVTRYVSTLERLLQFVPQKKSN